LSLYIKRHEKKLTIHNRKSFTWEGTKARGVEVLSITRDYELLKTITSTAAHAFGLMVNVVRNMVVLLRTRGLQRSLYSR